MNTSPYNNPFYFALPKHGAKPGMIRSARAHIASTFGIRGRVEFVSTEDTFFLYRVVSS